MISNWTYTEIPDSIDLTRPLMPLRDEDDNGIYGVDPAWLHEVLCCWRGRKPTEVKRELPERPSADFINAIYNHARNLSGSLFLDVNGNSIEFGRIPNDVSPGDPV